MIASALTLSVNAANVCVQSFYIEEDIDLFGRQQYTVCIIILIQGLLVYVSNHASV